MVIWQVNWKESGRIMEYYRTLHPYLPGYHENPFGIISVPNKTQTEHLLSVGLQNIDNSIQVSESCLRSWQLLRWLIKYFLFSQFNRCIPWYTITGTAKFTEHKRAYSHQLEGMSTLVHVFHATFFFMILLKRNWPIFFFHILH